MKFILWTLVWFGIHIVEKFLLVKQMGGWKAYLFEYSEAARNFVTVVVLVLWIVLYYAIIRREK